MFRNGFLLGLGLLFSLSASLSISAQESVLRVGLPAVVNINPATGSNDPEVMFNHLIYDYLYSLSADNELIPNLATGYEVSEDGLVYTFTLREGVTFHDGSPFSAADVVFSYNYLKEQGSPALNLLGDFEIAGEGLTVTFTLPQPNADFIYGIASNWAFILPDGATTPNVIGDSTNDFSNFNGTGAFKLIAYSPNAFALFERNPNYWMEGAPLLDRVELIFINDQQAQIDALRSGAVDFIFKIAYEQLDEVSGPGIVPIVKATNQHPVIRLRSDAQGLGADVRVRQAFKFATDRELLNINLFDGVATVGNNDPIGPLYGPFFHDDIPNQEFNPARSCELLAEAGYPDGLGADEPIVFYIDDSFNYVQMAEFLQQDWAEGCIFVELLPRLPGEYYAGDADTAEWLNVDLAVTGWGSRPTPQQYLVEAYVTGASFNESRWSDPELDALVAQAGATADVDERAALYRQIALIFAERGPIIVPFFAPIIGFTTDRVSGLDMHPFPGRTDLRMVQVGP
ncbi:MAG: ABC transporter substrate-binding protein [Anaerolineae bacterium]